MVESGGLENRCTRKGTVGSNPTLSATKIADFGLWIADCGISFNPKSNPQSAILERCRSGLTGSTGNAVYGKLYRGFESHPLRHAIADFGLWIADSEHPY